MAKEILFREGALSGLPTFANSIKAERILLIATESRIEKIDLKLLYQQFDVRHFSAFYPNPQFSSVADAIRVRNRLEPDLIVGLGGGSAMDVAKAARALPTEVNVAREWLLSGLCEVDLHRPRLALIPTTAGTGSEVTSFATIFSDGQKYSIDNECVSADIAIVDPTLTWTCPADITSSCALDAMCHAIESWWSRRATVTSAEYSLQALHILIPLLRNGLVRPSREQRADLSRAAVLAGEAINITRTTAAHAFAYPLTINFGVPHGLACALNLQWVWRYNMQFGDEAVRKRILRISNGLGVEDPDLVPDSIREVIQTNGFKTHLKYYGMQSGYIDELIRQGLLTRARIDNNPVPLRRHRVEAVLATVF